VLLPLRRQASELQRLKSKGFCVLKVSMALWFLYLPIDSITGLVLELSINCGSD